jgi:hypothetical protein
MSVADMPTPLAAPTPPGGRLEKTPGVAPTPHPLSVSPEGYTGPVLTGAIDDY